jgi:hypothetical protein
MPNYASGLTNIKNKTPGEITGRFFFSSGLCSCEDVLFAIAAAFLVACNALA